MRAAGQILDKGYRMASFEVRRNGVSIGSFNPSQLKEAVKNGVVVKTDEVRPEGSDKWFEAGGIDALNFPDAKLAIPQVNHTAILNKTKSLSPTFFGDLIGKSTDFVKHLLNGSLFESNYERAKLVGHYALSFGVIMTAVVGTYLAFKQDSIQALGIVAGIVVGISMAQYLAIRFFIDADKLLKSTPTRMSGTTLLDGFGILSVASSLGIAGFAVYQSLQYFDEYVLLGALGIAAILLLIATLAFNPKILNIEVTENASGGEEAVGLASFLVKSLLIVAPFVYLASGLASMGLYLYGWYLAITEEGGWLALAGFFAICPPILIGGALYPLALYLVFLIYYLFIDVLNSILQINNRVKEISQNMED